MKKISNKVTWLVLFILTALTVCIVQAQSNVKGMPSSNNTSAAQVTRDKEVIKRELMTIFFAKWDSETWEEISDLLVECPALINERMHVVGLLHRAVQEGNLEAAEWLISHGVDVNVKADGGATPLFFVRDVETARWLLVHGADVDAVNAAGQTALYRILAYPLWLYPERVAEERVESEKIASLLIECGANIDQEDNDGNDFLHVLAIGEHYRWLGYYLRNGDNPDTKNRAGQGIWFKPVMRHQDACVDWLEKQGVKYDPKDEALVQTVLTSANTHVMKKLQKKGFDINRKDSKTGLTLLENEIANGNNTNAFNMLKECGARGVNAKKTHNGKSLMCSAVKNVEFTKYLIAQGYNVNSKDSDGQSPLFSAILAGQKDVVEVLLNNGADKNEISAVNSDAFGWLEEEKIVRLKRLTPLILAVCGHGFRKDILEVLLAHGVDVNTRTPEGYTALGVAEKIQSKDIADLLRQKGGVE